MAFEVDDLNTVVPELKRRGVLFEEVDLPSLRTTDGIAEVEGNQPSKGGKGERAAWVWRQRRQSAGARPAMR